MSPDPLSIRVEALEEQVAVLRSVVGSDRSGLDDPELIAARARLLNLEARVRVLEETAVAGRRK